MGSTIAADIPFAILAGSGDRPVLGLGAIDIEQQAWRNARQLSRFIRSSAHHRAISAPGNNNRFATELRIVPLLYGRIKRVHIDMNNLASGHLASILFRGPDECERLLNSSAFVFLKDAMKRQLQARLDSLPKSEASFVEPMECLSVSRLPEGERWIWEILCGGPHKASWTKPLRGR